MGRREGEEGEVERWGGKREEGKRRHSVERERDVGGTEGREEED